MKWLLYFLAALLAAITLGTLIGRDPGRVVMIWGGWSVETSAVFFVTALLGVALLLYLAVRLLRGLLRLPELVRRWRGDRQSLQAEELLARGLLRLYSGDWRAAERDFKRWSGRGCNVMLANLYAAKAAHAQGAGRRRDHYLKAAAAASGDISSFVLVRSTLLPELPGAREDLVRLAHDGAAAALPQVREALLDSSLEQRDWEGARSHLAALVQQGGADESRAEAVRKRVAHGMLSGADSDESLRRVWSELPQELRRQPELLEAFVRARLRHDGAPECEAMVADVLSRHWDGSLVRLFGEVQGADPGRQLRIAEGWLKRHGPGAELLLTLGRIALRADQGDQGQAWLEESLKLAPSSAAHRELARWFEQRGAATLALQHYRQALETPADS